uniref:Uncharacterized protein n=1 Tax=Alexandrium monilatum TaxID=311494 RepID=A0A7S4Q9E6_9DINO
MDRPLAMSVMTFPGTVDQRLAGRPRRGSPPGRGSRLTRRRRSLRWRRHGGRELRWHLTRGQVQVDGLRRDGQARRQEVRPGGTSKGGLTFSRHREEEEYRYTIVVRCNTMDEIFMAAPATFTALRVSVGGFQKLLASLQSINEGADGEEELLDRFMDTIDDETEFQYWFEKTMPLVMNTVGTVLAEETTVQGRAAAPSEQGSSP